jgi:glycosyltransferase involved in cell wall biosynthesis
MPAAPPSPRLAIVLSHATQYYAPWFRWLRAHTRLTFRVFYLDDSGLAQAHDEKFQTTFAWDVDLTTGYDWELVENTARHPSTLRFFGLKNPSLPARLENWAPDAILLFGYAYRTHLRLIVRARRKKMPLLFRGDSHLLGRPAPRGLKRALLTLLYRQFAAITHVGAANHDYFRHHGVPAEKLFFAPHAVDAAHFDPALPAHQRSSLALRVELGLPADTRIVLFAGKLIAQKQPLALLEAFLALNPPKTALLFVGDGPEKPALLARAAAAREDVALQFLPFANQSEMPARYLLADLLVLPSHGPYETWGLAVNEAMHLGAPCLVSDEVGCARDLVTDGETGWVFRAGDPVQLCEKLAAALDALEKNAAFIRAAVASRIAGYTYAQTSAGLLAALEAAAGSAAPGAPTPNANLPTRASALPS